MIALALGWKIVLAFVIAFVAGCVGLAVVMEGSMETDRLRIKSTVAMCIITVIATSLLVLLFTRF